MKKNGFFKSELGSLIALISIVLAFAVTVTACLLILSDAGLMPKLSIFGGTETTERKVPPETGQSSHGGNAYVSPLENKENIYEFLRKTPYTDSYRAEYYIQYSALYSGSAQYLEKHCEIYKREDDYKLIVRSSTGNPELRIIVLDGTVYVYDYINGISRKYPYTEAYSLTRRAGIPDFDMLSDDEYVLTQAYTGGSEYIVTGRCDRLGVENEYRIDIKTGALSTVYSSLNGNNFCVCNLIFYDAEYAFSDIDFKAE